MKKHLNYLNYIIRHKYFVFIAGLKLKAPIFRLIIHDWTKFLPSEWKAYANFFYGSEEEKDSAQFKAAWNYHQKRNKHHWQYWLLKNDSGKAECISMPDKYIKEMVADWMGAGRAITGQWDIKNWYKKNSKTIKLHKDSRKKVNNIIDNL